MCDMYQGRMYQSINSIGRFYVCLIKYLISFDIIKKTITISDRQ